MPRATALPRLKAAAPATTAQIQVALATVGVKDARVNVLGKTGDTQPNERYQIETQVDFGDNTTKVWQALGTVGKVDRAQSDLSAVGPSLGREYLIAALEALVIAIGIQFLYIAFRFGVVIALVRDAAMMIGIYALADKRADDAFLAAVLTVIGYSVMDTIVILDRIRENVKVMAGEPYDKIVNTSILQTMTRSVNTLATVIITLVALLAFGGASLQNFAFALLVGICSGGYHSIFYSAPLVHILRERQLASAATHRQLERANALQRPTTVAEARAQAANAATRDQIVAARKARKQKSTSSRPTTGPVRYKRSRPATDAGSSSSIATRPVDEELPEDVPEYEADLYDPTYHGETLAVDPLDAQNAGMHDEAFEMGHEEITLNLGDGEHEGTPAESPDAGHPKAD